MKGLYMTDKGYYIGIDLGTSSVKLMLVGSEGSIVRTVSREYPLIFPNPGWSEQFPDDWWNAVRDGLKELTDGLEPDQIKGLSLIHI